MDSGTHNRSLSSLVTGLVLFPAGLLSLCLFGTLCGMAQGKKQQQQAGYDRAARATLVREANVYVAADANSQKLSEVSPGHEVVISERNGEWMKVFANTDAKDVVNEDDQPEFTDKEATSPISGWIRSKGVVTVATPGGDMVLFGAAANAEDAASAPHAPASAAAEAHLLYRRVFEYFPQSPLAAEAAWRSADVRWQIDQHDARSLPSAKEQEAYLRPQVYEGEMKHVIKAYPGSKYAAYAAFSLIDNKLCGDWQGLPKCPEMEAGLYEKYAKQFPDGPRTAQALYDAAYREGVAVTMWTVQEEQKHADSSARNVQALADQAKAQFPDTDWTARAETIAYKVREGIAVFGSDRE